MARRRAGQGPATGRSAATAEEAARYAALLLPLGPVETRRFFGGTGLLLDGTLFGFVHGGELWLRVDEAGRRAFEAAGARPFSYRTATREVTVGAYWAAPEEVRLVPEVLHDWAARALAAARANPPKRRGAARRRA